VSDGFSYVGTTENTFMQIILNSGEEKFVPAYSLDSLIEGKKIAAFLRSDGWVQVDRDPIRKGSPVTWTGYRWSDFMSRRSSY
jgi:spermidine synthase